MAQRPAAACALARSRIWARGGGPAGPTTRLCFSFACRCGRKGGKDPSSGLGWCWGEGGSPRGRPSGARGLLPSLPVLRGAGGFPSSPSSQGMAELFPKTRSTFWEQSRNRVLVQHRAPDHPAAAPFGGEAGSAQKPSTMEGLRTPIPVPPVPKTRVLSSPGSCLLAWRLSEPNTMGLVCTKPSCSPPPRPLLQLGLSNHASLGGSSFSTTSPKNKKKIKKLKKKSTTAFLEAD